MARRTQKISFRERIRSWRNARAKRPTLRDWNWAVILKVIAVLIFLAASGAFLRYAEAYVRTISPAAEGPLVLVGVPEWVKGDLRERVAQVAGGTRFPLAEETAAVVARNLKPMSWLDNVDVQVTHNSVRVKARWRKPVARIEVPEDRSKIYVDADLVVLDYMPMPHLPIVELKGVSLNWVPLPGQVFDQQDVAAGVALPSRMYRWREIVEKNAAKSGGLERQNRFWRERRDVNDPLSRQDTPIVESPRHSLQDRLYLTGQCIRLHCKMKFQTASLYH